MAARHPKYLTIQAQCENAFSDEAMESVIRGLSADTSLIFSRPLTLREGDSKDWIGFIEKLQRASWAFSAGSVTDMAGFVGKLKSAPHLKPSPTVPSASDVTPREGKPGSDLRVTQETRLPSDATTNSVGGRATDKLSDTKSPCEAGPTKNGLEQAEPKPASKLEAVVRPEADLNAASGKALDSNATTRSGEIRADNPSDAKPKKDAKKVQPKGESDPMLSGNGGEELTIDSLPSLLYGKLSAQTVRALADWQPGSDLKVLQKHLVQDLNAVINGDSIYTPRRFVGVKMRPETTKLLEEDPQGGEMVRLNRLLLEDAYPQEIERKRQSEEPLFDALWQRFDKATRDQLQEGENSAQSRNKSASFILDEINRVISEEPIFSQEFSSRASLRPWIQVMMCRSPKRTALVRLNRFALETAIPELETILDSADEDGNTLFHQAVRFGKGRIYNFLITCGVDLEQKNKAGETPLHLAASRSINDAVVRLIELKVDVNPTDNQGRTPLDRAVEHGMTSCANLLRKHGARESKKQTAEVAQSVSQPGDTEAAKSPS